MNHNSIRKWLPFSLICVLVLAVLVLIPVPAHAAPTHYAATFSDLQSALTQVDNNGTIYITASFDITAALAMPTGKSITIQSSGGPYTLSRGASYNADMIQVPADSTLTLQSVTINGTLRSAYGNAVLCNGSNATLNLNTGATITNNIKPNSYAGGLNVWDGGTCNMYAGATISNNTATNNAGGGVYILGGTFNMYGGTITGNTSFIGGGVSVSDSTYPAFSDGIFNMSGGTINGNSATRGGVAVRSNGIFNMSGGVITNNGDYGVYWETGSVNLSGNPQIGTSTSDNSLYRNAVGQVIGVSDAALGGSAFINVAAQAGDAVGTVIAQKGSANFTAAELGYFHYLGSYPTVINPSNQRQIILGALTNASVNPTTATFDKYAASAGYVDVPTTLTPGSYALNGITLGGTALTAGTHYTVSGNTYTFLRGYLATLGTGAQAFAFNMSGGTSPTFTVTVSDSTPAPTDASVNPTTATFDKYAASAGYVDVPTTLTPGSYALNSITLGGTTLTAGTHYTVSGNTYTFLRGYLATLGTGPQTFTFVMNGGTNPTFTVTVSDSTPGPTDASVSPTTATFDKYAASVGYMDVPTTLTPGSYALNSITLGGTTLTAGTHYTVSGNTYTFLRGYLATLGTGPQTFTFVMNGGTNPTFTVTVSDSTPAPVDASVSPTTATFDKYAASVGYADVPTTLTPGSYALNSITLGGTALTEGTHYTVSGNTHTFLRGYLATLGTGPQVFTFVMSGGTNPTFTVTVSDSTPGPAVSAAVGNVTISGTVGSALGGGQRATITLTGDTVAGNLVNADASGWFTGLPAGITVTANASAGGSTITLTFGGTPTAASTARFNITIPGNVLTGGNPISVTSNPNAKFRITRAIEPPSPLPKTGDGFPLYALLALLGVGLTAMACLGARLRKQRKRA